MDFLYNVSVDPVLQIVEDPVFFIQVIAEGLMAGVMYSLVALGFCLIYKASGVFNFAPVSYTHLTLPTNREV